jgi:predicted ATPase
LHASLMARLDRLGRAKELAQIAAAIGRECSYAVLAAVSSLHGHEMSAALERLIAAGLISARGTPPEASYLFKHALVQDAAYGTLLISTRQRLHLRIAEAIEKEFPDLAAREPEVLARHFAEGRQPERALGYWIKAGRFAAERSANLEAIRHLSRALDTLALLPEGEDRDRQELTAQSALGTALMSVHGYAAPETGTAWGRARVLSRRLGDRAGMYATLSGEYPYHFVRGDPALMAQVERETIAAAEAADDASLRLAGHRFAGMGAMYAGDFERAIEEFGTITTRYQASKHRPPPVHYVHDPKSIAVGYLPVLKWIQGRPDEARQWSAASVEYAAELHHAMVSAFEHVYGGAGFHELVYETDAVRKHAAAVLELADQYSLFYFRLSGLVLQGWLMAQDGDAAEGIALMRRTIEQRFALGVGWYQVRYLCMLAEVCLRQGDARSGLEAIARAKSHMDSHREPLWKAEVRRLEGELLRLEGAASNEVEACFRDAYTVARAQRALSFELRAASSLARLRLEQGRPAAARDELEPVLARFTQGFDTPDVRQAAQLLDRLGLSPKCKAARHVEWVSSAPARGDPESS